MSYYKKIKVFYEAVNECYSITQKDFAKHFGKDENTIGNWFSGEYENKDMSEEKRNEFLAKLPLYKKDIKGLWNKSDDEFASILRKAFFKKLMNGKKEVIYDRPFRECALCTKNNTVDYNDRFFYKFLDFNKNSKEGEERHWLLCQYIPSAKKSTNSELFISRIIITIDQHQRFKVKMSSYEKNHFGDFIVHGFAYYYDKNKQVSFDLLTYGNDDEEESLKNKTVEERISLSFHVNSHKNQCRLGMGSGISTFDHRRMPLAIPVLLLPVNDRYDKDKLAQLSNKIKETITDIFDEFFSNNSESFILSYSEFYEKTEKNNPDFFKSLLDDLGIYK